MTSVAHADPLGHRAPRRQDCSPLWPPSPTLLASIYGMNFRFMPELSWELGYPFALSLMAASVIAPFWYFRRKGWL